MKRIAIIGAGIAGLTLAREIHRLARVTVFEKSRGFGGRMATRQAKPYQFDHGAQFFTAKSEPFASFLKPYIASGHVARWDAEFVEIESDNIICRRNWKDGPPHYVCAPKMNALAKQMAADLDVVLQTRVTRIAGMKSRWRLYDENQVSLGEFDWVVLAIPARQALDLMPESFADLGIIAAKQMLGCYSLMLGFKQVLSLGWQAAFVSGADISWISNDSSKPGRPDCETLLVHSTNRWAEQNLEADHDRVVAYLLAELERVIRHDVSGADHVSLQRWRYANIARQNGADFLIDPGQKLAAVGDWCIHGRIESAYLSGFRLARELVPGI
ncbi:MAG: FAD-dependent oxidoreductase [Gammaproteobacteria bacterium]|nr:FAD-dependent oxidoreductase [Gammaproteobacteria bacterium]